MTNDGRMPDDDDEDNDDGIDDETSEVEEEEEGPQEFYPYSVVWTPIPVITWMLPFVGHAGICDSRGVIYDFAGPYYIGAKHLAFGRATRVLRLDRVAVSPAAYDEAVKHANCIYKKRMHNICFQNCHSHVCTVLDRIGYLGFHRWNMIILAAWIFFLAPFVSASAALRTLLPSMVIWGSIMFIVLYVQ